MSEEMARTEAIEVLKDIVSKPMLYSNHIIGACRVALASLETDEAYQLEYEQPEFCKDCISRKSVLNGINEAMNYIDWGQSQDGDAFRHLCASLYRTITDMPSVLPKATKNDLVTLTFSKGTLKYSCKDYVVYKKDWLRSHYGAEIDIMFGDSQYKEPTTKNDLGVDVPDNNVGNIDCISREQAKAETEG